MKNFKIIKKKLIVICIPFFLLFVFLPFFTSSQDHQINDLEFYLIHESTGEILAASDSVVELTFQTEQVKSQEEFIEIFLQNHISPDAEAYLAVYMNNEPFDSLSLAKGMKLNFPKIVENSRIENKLDEGFLVAFNFNKSLKEEILYYSDSINTFLNNNSTFVEILFNSNENQNYQDSLFMCVNFINATCEIIKGVPKARSLNNDFLSQVLIETEYLYKALISSHSEQRELTDEEKETLKYISDDFHIKSDFYTNTKGWGSNNLSRYTIGLVKIYILPFDSTTTNYIRVFYQLEAAFKGYLNQEPEIIYTTFSPLQKYIFPANYRIWGSRIGDPNKTPITEILSIDADDFVKDSILSINLPIIK